MAAAAVSSAVNAARKVAVNTFGVDAFTIAGASGLVSGRALHPLPYTCTMYRLKLIVVQSMARLFRRVDSTTELDLHTPLKLRRRYSHYYLIMDKLVLLKCMLFIYLHPCSPGPGIHGTWRAREGDRASVQLSATSSIHEMSVAKSTHKRHRADTPILLFKSNSGAGTGIFTSNLVNAPTAKNKIASITAIEPSSGMREAFTKNENLKQFQSSGNGDDGPVPPRLEVKDGSFAEIPVPDASVDLIVGE
jgi:hypothetical protein